MSCAKPQSQLAKIDPIPTSTTATLRASTWYQGKLLICGGDAFNSSVLLEYDTALQMIKEIPLPTESTKEQFTITTFQSSWISGGESGLALIGNPNSVLWQQSEYYRIHKILTIEDFFYLVINSPQGSKIFKYDSTFTLQKIFSYSHDIQDIVFRENQLMVCGTGFIARITDPEIEYAAIKGDVFVRLAWIQNKWYALGLKGRLYESTADGKAWKQLISIPGHCIQLVTHEQRNALLMIGDGSRCYEYHVGSQQLSEIKGLDGLSIKNASVLNKSTYILYGEKGEMRRIEL